MLAITVYAPGSPYAATRSIFHDDYITVGYMRLNNEDVVDYASLFHYCVPYFETGIDCTGPVWGSCKSDSSQVDLDVEAGKDISLFSNPHFSVMHVARDNDQSGGMKAILSAWLYSVASAYL